MKRIKKYLPFFRASIMQMFIYRGTIWLWLLVDVFQFVMMIFLWKSVFQYNDTISGFTFNQMLVYFLATNLFFIFTDLDTVWAMSEEIKEGRISLYMVKPISYKIRLVFEVAGRALGVLILLLPVVFLTGLVITFVFDIVWTVSMIGVVLSILYIPLMLLLMFEFAFFFGTLVIYTNNEFGLVIFMSVFIRIVSGQLIPIALYPTFLQNIVAWMPFRFISYPPLIIIGKISTSEAFTGLGVLLLWVILFKIINHFVYRFSVKKMVVFGG
jgi:ABC-2 type transport system permease protein